MALGFSLFYALLVGSSEMFVFVVCDIMKLQYNFSFKPGNLFIYSLLLNMISCIVYCGITCHTQPCKMSNEMQAYSCMLRCLNTRWFGQRDRREGTSRNCDWKCTSNAIGKYTWLLLGGTL